MPLTSADSSIVDARTQPSSPEVKPCGDKGRRRVRDKGDVCDAREYPLRSYHLSSRFYHFEEAEMIIPKLFQFQTHRHHDRPPRGGLHKDKRQLGDIGLPGQFTTPVIAGTDERLPTTTTTPRTNVAVTTGQRTGTGVSTSQRKSSSISTGHAEGTSASSVLGSIRATSKSIGPTTAPITTAGRTTQSASTSKELIFLTTIPSDFPLAQQDGPFRDQPGRGYVFLSDSELGDAMLLFATFCAGFFIFSLLLIRLTKAHERSKGRMEEDKMVRDDMRWAEGREVVEKRIIYDGRGGDDLGDGDRESIPVPPVPRLPARPYHSNESGQSASRDLVPQDLARRTSRGKGPVK